MPRLPYIKNTPNPPSFIFFEKKEIKYNRKDITVKLKEAREILKENSLIINKIKMFRDKVYAHIDEDFPSERLISNLRKKK